VETKSTLNKTMGKLWKLGEELTHLIEEIKIAHGMQDSEIPYIKGLNAA